MAVHVLGKLVFETLEEIVNPAHTALVVVDMQNECCKPEGTWGRRWGVAPIEAIVPSLQQMVAGAREAGVPVIWIQNVIKKGARNLSPAYLRFFLYKCAVPPGEKQLEEGSWGAEIIPKLEVAPDEIRVYKARSSAFIGTDLDLILRSNLVQTVVLTGMATQACVESTLRDCMCLDYYTVLVSDGVATYQSEQHRDAMQVMAALVDVAMASELTRIWRRQGVAPGVPGAGG